MGNLYSRRFLILRAAYGVLLPIVYALVSYLAGAENTLAYVLISLFVLALLYAVPLCWTTWRLRRGPIAFVGPVILADALAYLLPVVLSCILTEAVQTVAAEDRTGAGFISLVIIVILTLISCVFWLYDWLLCRRGRK